MVQVWRLLVHGQAYLPKRARKQAAVRLCGALLNDAILLARQFSDRLRDRVNDFICFGGIDFV
jgi:hypothetical protein